MLNFDVMKPSLLEDWEIANGANEHIYKLCKYYLKRAFLTYLGLFARLVLGGLCLIA